MPEVYVTLPSYGRIDLLTRLLPEMDKAGMPFRLLTLLDEKVPMPGVPVARNILIKTATQDPSCRFIATLSNDVYKFPQNWLKTLYDFLKAFPEIGCVNGMVVVDYGDGKGWGNFGTEGNWIAEDGMWSNVPNYTTRNVNGPISLIRADIHRELGYYDLHYGMGSYEGHDMALRMMMAGWDIVTTPRVRVRHDILTGNCKNFDAVYHDDVYGPYHGEKWGKLASGSTDEEVRTAFKEGFKPAFEGRIW